MRPKLIAAFFCAAITMASPAVTSPAASAGDTTPPTLTAPIKASFTVGGQLTQGHPPDCGNNEPGDIWAWLPINFSWRGSDASGYVRYTLEESDGAIGTYEVLSNSTKTSYTSQVSANDDSSCGGGNTTINRWDLTARDAAGNATSRVIYGGQMRLTQDTNLADRTYYAPRAAITYAGSWALASCQCWSDGGTHKTQGIGASATIRLAEYEVDYNDDPLYPAHVGLIMHTGPDRGKVKVYVNGVLNATVDTYAATAKPRVMVWQTSVPNRDTVIKIVNQATAGRSRVDLDAVVTN